MGFIFLLSLDFRLSSLRGAVTGRFKRCGSLSFSPFRKTALAGRSSPLLPCGAASPALDSCPAARRHRESLGRAGRKRPVLFNGDWQVPSAGGVTHPGLPRWRLLLARHQRSSLCFQSRAEPRPSLDEGCFPGPGVSRCVEGGEMRPDLKGIGD